MAVATSSCQTEPDTVERTGQQELPSNVTKATTITSNTSADSIDFETAKS
jgi:hypothetical protein